MEPIVRTVNDNFYLVDRDTGEILEEKSRRQIPKFRVKGDFARARINTDSLAANHAAHITRLSQKGINAAQFPSVTLSLTRAGDMKLRYRKSANRWLLSYPLQGGNRSNFRKEVYKIHGRSALAQIQKEQTHQYRKTSKRCAQSFRKSQRILARYIMLGTDRHRLAKVLSLMIFGKTNQLKCNFPCPRALGVVDYSKRCRWKDEFLSIYSEIERQGLSAFATEQARHFNQAALELLSAEECCFSVNRFHPEYRRAKRRYYRACCRMEAQRVFSAKIKVIRHLLF